MARQHLHGCHKLIPWRGTRVERFAVNSCFSQREGQSQKTNKRCGCLEIRHYVPCIASAQPQEYKTEWRKKTILPFQADVGYIAAKKCINCWAERGIKEDSFSQKAVQFFILKKKFAIISEFHTYRSFKEMMGMVPLPPPFLTGVSFSSNMRPNTAL